MSIKDEIEQLKKQQQQEAIEPVEVAPITSTDKGSRAAADEPQLTKPQEEPMSTTQSTLVKDETTALNPSDLNLEANYNEADADQKANPNVTDKVNDIIYSTALGSTSKQPPESANATLEAELAAGLQRPSVAASDELGELPPVRLEAIDQVAPDLEPDRLLTPIQAATKPSGEVVTPSSKATIVTQSALDALPSRLIADKPLPNTIEAPQLRFRLDRDTSVPISQATMIDPDLKQLDIRLSNGTPFLKVLPSPTGREVGKWFIVKAGVALTPTEFESTWQEALNNLDEFQLDNL